MYLLILASKVVPVDIVQRPLLIIDSYCIICSIHTRTSFKVEHEEILFWINIVVEYFWLVFKLQDWVLVLMEMLLMKMSSLLSLWSNINSGKYHKCQTKGLGSCHCRYPEALRCSRGSFCRNPAIIITGCEARF
jgi:hypothetical protein